MVWNRQESLARRCRRVRAKVSGTPQRPRLCIHKSLKHLYAQVIDDTRGVTICAATTNTKKNKGDAARGFANVAAARRLGGELAALARSRGVDQVVFDRGGCRYHGVIKAFGDAAREGGLKF